MTDIIDDYLPHTAFKEVSGSAIIFEGDVTADGPLAPLAGPPVDDFYVKVTASGIDCIGSVTITGEKSGGGGVSETLSYTSCRDKQTGYEFKASTPLTSITTSGLSNSHVKCEYCDISGNLLTGAASWTPFSCRWDDLQVGFWDDSGNWILCNAEMICKEAVLITDNIKYNDIQHTPEKVAPHADLEGNVQFYVILF